MFSWEKKNSMDRWCSAVDRRWHGRGENWNKIQLRVAGCLQTIWPTIYKRWTKLLLNSNLDYFFWSTFVTRSKKSTYRTFILVEFSFHVTLTSRIFHSFGINIPRNFAPNVKHCSKTLTINMCTRRSCCKRGQSLPPYFPLHPFAILLLPYPPLSSCNVHSVSFLLCCEVDPVNTTMGSGLRCKPPSGVWGRASQWVCGRASQWGLGQSLPVGSGEQPQPQLQFRYILNWWNVSCGSDFGSFLYEPKCCNWSKCSIVYFPGDGKCPVLPMAVGAHDNRNYGLRHTNNNRHIPELSHSGQLKPTSRYMCVMITLPLSRSSTKSWK